MSKAEQQKPKRHPIKGPLYTFISGALVLSAIGPFERRVLHTKEPNPKRKHQAETDKIRLVLGGAALAVIAEAYILPKLTKNGLSIEDAIKKVRTEGFDLLGFHIKPEMLAIGAIAGGALGLEALHMLENRRKTESLATTDQKVTQVKQLYESEVARQTTVTIDGQKVAVNGAQERAKTYATKYLGELRASAKDQKAFDRDVAAARKAVAGVFASTDGEARQAAVRVTGDAFESITDREIRETAVSITERPQDHIMSAVGLIARAAKTVTPGAGILTAVAGKGLEGTGLDPRSIVTSGAQEARQAVTAKLSSEFADLLGQEAAVDATPSDLALLNAMPGLTDRPLSETKNAQMNVLFACALVQQHPDAAPANAQLVGVVDAIQAKTLSLPSANSRRK